MVFEYFLILLEFHHDLWRRGENCSGIYTCGPQKYRSD